MCCFSNNCAFLREYVLSVTMVVSIECVCVCVCVSARFLLSVLATFHSLDCGQLADRLPELPGLNS